MPRKFNLLRNTYHNNSVIYNIPTQVRIYDSSLGTFALWDKCSGTRASKYAAQGPSICPNALLMNS